MKPSELRDKTDEELREVEKDLRDKLVQLSVAKATQRQRNSSQFSRLRKDIARVLTIFKERQSSRAERAGGSIDSSGIEAPAEAEG